DGGPERRFDGSASLVVKGHRHNAICKLPVQTRNGINRHFIAQKHSLSLTIQDIPQAKSFYDGTASFSLIDSYGALILNFFVF
ncbi:MAG: hypothetical protein NTY51_08625, partial [Deltaproteobacteria bacterium]|nr:hypothetical protein [Deltaproteobacteria bacterium]